MVKRIFRTVKNILFADPRRLYREQLDLINKPFRFEGANGKAVLIIHGWTSTPYEVRRLGKYLNENGYTVSGPQLRGHGTVPKDLEEIKWQEWFQDIEKEYCELKKNHRKVFVAGTSIGSNLALLLASTNKNVAGLILMATPYAIKFESLAVMLARLNLFFRKYNKKHYPPTFGVSTTITRLISYKRYPIRNALEIFKLVKKSREELSRILQPCLILQSTHDHVICRKSAENIYCSIGSVQKKIKYIRRAYHTFISDIKNDYVFKDILDFLNEN